MADTAINLLAGEFLPGANSADRTLVRRLCAATGHAVARLRRVQIGGLALGSLAPGRWRLVDDVACPGQGSLQVDRGGASAAPGLMTAVDCSGQSSRNAPVSRSRPACQFAAVGLFYEHRCDPA